MMFNMIEREMFSGSRKIFGFKLTEFMAHLSLIKQEVQLTVCRYISTVCIN